MNNPLGASRRWCRKVVVAPIGWGVNVHTSDDLDCSPIYVEPGSPQMRAHVCLRNSALTVSDYALVLEDGYGLRELAEAFWGVMTLDHQLGLGHLTPQVFDPRPG